RAAAGRGTAARRLPRGRAAPGLGRRLLRRQDRSTGARAPLRRRSPRVECRDHRPQPPAERVPPLYAVTGGPSMHVIATLLIFLAVTTLPHLHAAVPHESAVPAYAEEQTI